MPELPSGTVTFLFTDIEGSTKRWERLPQAMAAAVARHDGLLRAAVATHRGHVFKTVGDAFCAAFPTPGEGLAAAIVSQRALVSEAWDETGPIRVRMALHTGVAEERDADYFGPPVNRVARVLSTGYGGQVLLSTATADLLRADLPADTSLLDLGLHRLKDLLQPERIFQLVAPDLAAEFPPLKSLDRQPHNLPAQATPLVGRTTEVAAARALLAEEGVRLLTLTGPGGIGKTRLGLQVAAELVGTVPDGVWFVPLAAVTDPDLVVPAIAQAVGVRDTGHEPLLTTLIEDLRSKETLLLLDNFEQVASAATVVGALLAGCPKLRVLVTSRAALRVYGERESPVPPLPLPDAKRVPPLAELEDFASVRLFVERAAAIKPGFALTAENAADVAAICVRLEGLPLAIELAAARVRILPPAALLTRLSNRLNLLTGGAADRDPRQRTLRGAIAWSHDLLEPAGQTLFRRLAVFAGGWTFEAAEAVCAAAGGDVAFDVLDGLDSLVQKSLLRQDETPEGEPRFTMLQTIREFGLEQLAVSGEEPAIRVAHAAYYLALAEEADPHLSGPDQRVWLDHLETEHDNLRATLAWSLEHADPETALRLGGLLWHFWARRGHLREGLSWFERALAESRHASPKVQATALIDIGNIASDLHDYERARWAYEESLAIWQTLENQPNQAISLSGLGRAARGQGELTQARNRYEESLAIWRTLGNHHVMAFTLDELGDVAYADGDVARARELHEAALEILLGLHDPGSVAYSYHKLGRVACHAGDCVAARRLLNEGMALFNEVGDKDGTASVRHALGVVASQEGNSQEAAVHFLESLTLRQEIDDIVGTIECLEGLAHVANADRVFEETVQLFAASSAQRAKLGVPTMRGDRTHHDRAIAKARASLDDTTYQSAWTKGAALSIDAAVMVARSLPSSCAAALYHPEPPLPSLTVR
ncbi:MAG: tetratricopeptide repeat protein [Chloroflexia bacterium]|nr:tetratricopeptide repeat protein [Chloroflexia bacterium]